MPITFDEHGNLTPGIHWIKWEVFVKNFGRNARRKMLISGLELALQSLEKAGCSIAYIDGSFVTTKDEPGDYDGCWDTQGVTIGLLDPVLLDFKDSRKSQKMKFQGEFFPAQMVEGKSRMIFLEFFQTDKNTGMRKGIIGLKLR